MQSKVSKSILLVNPNTSLDEEQKVEEPTAAHQPIQDHVDKTEENAAEKLHSYGNGGPERRGNRDNKRG